MSLALPDSLLVLERGWLSANNILCFDGDEATLIDSGYVAHAAQTVDLVGHNLQGRQLKRLINTHAHSDHIGGNAAIQARFGCTIAVPAGLDATIAEWDEAALLLSPLGQQAARFQHDGVIEAGSELAMGDLVWQALAVPGHDMAALAYFNPERGLLISGDALWENGFGVIFPELLGQADGLQSTRATLESLARLPIRGVIPGHGRPFAEVDLAFERAFRRLDSFQANIEQLAWHAIKVIVAFAMMEKRRLPERDFPAFVLDLPFAVDVNRRYLGQDEGQLVDRLERELLLVNALRRDAGDFVAG
jgi:glyoxylase-like metal-dependent hydrolase (beta-lactamase superfamily II)